MRDYYCFPVIACERRMGAHDAGCVMNRTKQFMNSQTVCLCRCYCEKLFESFKDLIMLSRPHQYAVSWRSKPFSNSYLKCCMCCVQCKLYPTVTVLEIVSS